MTVAEAAKLLGVSGACVRALFAKGTIKGKHINPRFLDLNAASVNAYLKRRAQKRLDIAAKKAAPKNKVGRPRKNINAEAK